MSFLVRLLLTALAIDIVATVYYILRVARQHRELGERYQALLDQRHDRLELVAQQRDQWRIKALKMRMDLQDAREELERVESLAIEQMRKYSKKTKGRGNAA